MSSLTSDLLFALENLPAVEDVAAYVAYCSARILLSPCANTRENFDLQRAPGVRRRPKKISERKGQQRLIWAEMTKFCVGYLKRELFRLG